MARKGKLPTEEKVRIVESYLSGKVSYTASYETAGIGETTLRRWINRYKVEGASGLLLNNHDKRYSKETKQSAVKNYLEGKGSLQDICNIYGIRHIQVLANWIKVYNSHEEFQILTGGSRMTKSRKTTPEERVEITRDCIRNNNYGEIALKYQVSYSQVYGWVKKYRAMGEAGLEDRRGRRSGTLPSRTPEEELRDRVAQLEREKLDLEMENALLKKVKELERRRR